MLVLALLALIVGILCLWVENAEYEWKYKGGPTVSASAEMDLAGLPVGQQWRPARNPDLRPAGVF